MPDLFAPPTGSLLAALLRRRACCYCGRWHAMPDQAYCPWCSSLHLDRRARGIDPLDPRALQAQCSQCRRFRRVSVVDPALDGACLCAACRADGLTARPRQAIPLIGHGICPCCSQAVDLIRLAEGAHCYYCGQPLLMYEPP